MSTRSARQDLGEFLTVLEQRLAALPVEDLRAALVTHAERLPAGNREAFLAIFPAPGAGVDEVPGPRLAPCPDGTRLLADIDAFVDRVRSGAFFEGWGWDDLRGVGMGRRVARGAGLGRRVMGRRDGRPVRRSRRRVPRR